MNVLLSQALLWSLLAALVCAFVALIGGDDQ